MEHIKLHRENAISKILTCIKLYRMNNLFLQKQILWVREGKREEGQDREKDYILKTKQNSKTTKKMETYQLVTIYALYWK